MDFDGFLSNSIHGGYDVNKFVFDPTPGAVGWVNEMIKEFDLIIFTARELSDKGKENLQSWLKKWGFPPLEVTNIKPPHGHIFCDDRAYHFNGTNWPTAEDISSFVPWNRVKK
jgi:hypothetical protein